LREKTLTLPPKNADRLGLFGMLSLKRITLNDMNVVLDKMNAGTPCVQVEM